MCVILETRHLQRTFSFKVTVCAVVRSSTAILLMFVSCSRLSFLLFIARCYA